jgi:hypothetical protein
MVHSKVREAACGVTHACKFRRLEQACIKGAATTCFKSFLFIGNTAKGLANAVDPSSLSTGSFSIFHIRPLS